MVHYDVTDIAHHHGTPTKHGRDGDGQRRLSVSPTLHARLAREAAERGMRLEDWAVLKRWASPVSQARRLRTLGWCRPGGRAADRGPLRGAGTRAASTGGPSPR
jgi:hypothetical protein